MPDSVQMINDMVEWMGALPKLANGDLRVDDPTAVAVAFVGIAAPVYGAEIDVQVSRAATAESLAAQRQDELIGLRAQVDHLRTVVAQAKGALAQGDMAAAQSALNVIGF